MSIGHNAPLLPSNNCPAPRTPSSGRGLGSPMWSHMRASSFVFARFRSFDDNQQQQQQWQLQQWQLLLLPLLLLLLLLSRRLWAASVETVWEITCDICSVAAGDQAAYSLSPAACPAREVVIFSCSSSSSYYTLPCTIRAPS